MSCKDNFSPLLGTVRAGHNMLEVRQLRVTELDDLSIYNQLDIAMADFILKGFDRRQL